MFDIYKNCLILIKLFFMNVAFEIKKIQKELELIQDENLIKSILVFAKKQKSNVAFNPFTLDEYLSLIHI